MARGRHRKPVVVLGGGESVKLEIADELNPENVRLLARHLMDYAREANEAEQKLKREMIAALDESDIDRAKAIMRRWLKKSAVDVAASL